MNNADNDTNAEIQQLLREMHNMSSKKNPATHHPTALTYHGPRQAKSSPKTKKKASSTVHSHVHGKPLNLPHSGASSAAVDLPRNHGNLSFVQQLQVKYNQVKHALAIQHAQCGDLQAMVADLAAAKSHHTTQVATLEAALASRDQEIHTLRDHVHDLYSVQQTLRAESLHKDIQLQQLQQQQRAAFVDDCHSCVCHSNAPSIAWSNDPIDAAAAAVVPTTSCSSASMPVDSSPVVHTLRVELQGLESQVACQSAELARVQKALGEAIDQSQVVEDAMRQWAAALALPSNNQSMEGGNNDEMMHGLALVNLVNDAITVHVQRPPPLEPYSALQSRAVHPLTTNEPDDRALNDVPGGGHEGPMPQWLADALATVEDSMDEASHALDMEVLQMELASLRRSLQQKDDELDAFELMVDSMQGQVSALATHRDLVEERCGVQPNAVMDMLLQVIYNNQDEPEEGEHQRDVEVGNTYSCDEETHTTEEEQIQRNETWDHVEVYGTLPLDTQDMTLTLQLGIARSDEYIQNDDVDGNREQRVVHSLLQNAIHVLRSSTTSSSISNDQNVHVQLEATATHLLEQVTAHQRQFELLQEEVTATKLALDSKSTRLTQLVDEHASLSVRSEALEGELVQRMTDIGVLEHRLLDNQVTTTSLTRELSAATNALETLGHDSATLQAELLHQSRELADVRQRFQYVCSHLQADMAAFCARSSVCHLLANDLVLGTVSSENDLSMSSDTFLRNPDCLDTTDECGSALLGAFAAFKERVAGQLYSLEQNVETFKGRLSHAKATTAETVRYYEDQRAIIQAQVAAQALVHKHKDAMMSDRDDLIAQLRMDLETKVDASRSLTALVERELAACKHENHTLTTSVREITSEIVVLQGKLAAQSTCTARQQTARELQLQLAQGTTQSERLVQVGRTTHQPLLATVLRHCGECTDELMVANTLDRVVLMCEWHGMFSALEQELASTKAQCHTLTSNQARDRNELDQCRQQLVQTREELTVAHEMQATHQDVMNMTTEMLKMNEDALEQSVAWFKLEAAESEKSICALTLDKLVLQVQSIHDHKQHDLELSMAVDEWKQAYHDIENHGHDDHRQWNHMDTILSRCSDRRSALSEAANIESAGFHQVLLGLKRCVVQEYARQKAVWMDSCRFHDKVDAAMRVSEQLREQCTSYETQLTSEREQHQYLARGWEDQHGQIEREVRHLESQLLDQATVHQHMVRTLKECQQEHLKAECHTYESQVLELQTRLSQLEVEYTKKNQAQLWQETEQHDAVVRALECQLGNVNLACQALNSKLLQQHEQHQLLVVDMEHRQEQLQAECSGWKTRLVALSDQHQHIVNDLERRQAQLLQVECSNWEAKVAEKSEQHLAQVEALECQLEQLQHERRLMESQVGAQIDQHRRLVCDLQCRQDQIHQLEVEMATQQHQVGELITALAASDSAKTLLQERCDAANAQSLLEVAACRSECQHLKTLLDQNRIEYDTFKADRLANEATLVASLQTEFKSLESTYEAQVEHWKTRVQSKDRSVSRLQHALWAMQLESELSLFQSKPSPSPTTSVEDSPSPTLLVQGTPCHDDEPIAVPQIADSFLKLGDDKTCQGGVFPQLEPTKRRRNNHRDSLWAIHQWRSAALEMEVQQEQYEMTLATSFQANETKSNQWQRTVEHNQAQYELGTEQLKQQLDLAQTIASQKGKDSAKWVHALRSVQLEMDGALDRYQQVAHQVKTLTSLNDMHLRTMDDLAAENKLLEGKSSALANQLAELSTLLTNERATSIVECNNSSKAILLPVGVASQEGKQGKCAPFKSTHGTLHVERTASQCRIQHKRELKWRHYVQSMQLELDGCFPTAPSSAMVHDAHTLLEPRTSTPHSVVTRTIAEVSQSRLNIADSARGLSRPSQSTTMMPQDLEWTWQVHEQVVDERKEQVHQAQVAMASSSPPMSPTSTTDPRLTTLKRRLDAATAENHALCTRLTDLTLDNHRLTVDLVDMRASIAAAESVEIPPTPTASPQRTDHPTTQTTPELLQCHFDTATGENDALRAQLRDWTLENHHVSVKLSENDKKTVAQATRHAAPMTQTPESASGTRQDSGTQTAESDLQVLVVVESGTQTAEEPDGVDAATGENHALCWQSTAQLSLDHHSCLMQDLRGGSNTQPTESGGSTVVESESESATPESTDREFASNVSNDVHAMYLSIPEAIDVPLITWKALANHIEELLSHAATAVAAIKQRPQQRRCLVGRLKRRLAMTLHTHNQHDPSASHPVVDVVHGLTSLGRLLATLLDPCTTTRATSFSSVSIRSRRDTPFLTSLSTAAAPRRPVHRPLLHPSSSSIDSATTSFNGGGIVLLDVGATQVRASLLPLLHGTTTMSSPPSILRFENSTLDDKNDVAGKVAKALEWLGLSAAHLPFVKVVLLHKPRLDPSRKEHLTTLLLQGFQLQGVNLTTHTQVALTGHTGLVIDIGHTSTYLVPVFEDMVLEHAVVTLDGGGSAVASHILAHIRHTNPTKSFQAVSGTAHLAEIERRLMEGRREDDWPASISDVFFQGSVDLAMAVRACVKHCDPFLHPALFGNIVLTGGAAALPGLADRLKMELLANSTPAQEVHVQVVTNVFDGAASHAKNLSPYKWVLQEDFRLHGARIVHAKCF